MSTAVIEEIKNVLLVENFDVLGYGSTNSYNSIASKHSNVLKPFPCNHTVICVGNSRFLWERAKELLASGEQDPFNTMSIACAQRCVEICDNRNINCTAYYSHIPYPFLVSFQHLAVETKIGILHPESQLIIHKTFGPWIAFRFALVLEIPYDSEIMRDENSSFTIDPTESSAVADILRGREYHPLRHIKARRTFRTGSAYAYSDEQTCYHYHLPHDSILSDNLIDY